MGDAVWGKKAIGTGRVDVGVQHVLVELKMLAKARAKLSEKCAGRPRQSSFSLADGGGTYPKDSVRLDVQFRNSVANGAGVKRF